MASLLPPPALARVALSIALSRDRKDIHAGKATHGAKVRKVMIPGAFEHASCGSNDGQQC